MLEPVFRAGDTYAVDPGIGREESLSYWFADGHTVLVAEDGEPLGTCFFCANKPGNADHVANAAFVTAPAATGRGVARAMLAEVLDAATARGFRAMQFNFVVSTNTRAIATWEKAGFREVGRLPGAFRHPTEGPVDALVLWKDLP
ncbi:GNAT family N-acetyltransferase [Rhodobacterales bacterium HKCCE2091]|nr:GNAT family N-acetyltransferase [Rhodobacterales bacterium HKCCE2091]